MPQIFIISRDSILNAVQLTQLGDELTPVVERCFGIVGKKDTACTAISGASVLEEADVQIEIRYTAGQDEYCRGVPFDPTLEVQKKLSKRIERAFRKFLKAENLTGFSLSVWCKPYYNSHFEMFPKQKGGSS